MKSCKDCIHSDVCASYFIASENFELCNVERMANDCDDFIKRIQSADVGKKDMPLTTALIILNNLNTTERIDVDREELIEAVKVVSAAAKRQLSVALTIKHGMATDSSGNEIPVKQPCCPIYGEAILNARQRRIEFCPSRGQAIQIERETEERN
ncbi:MAG: hypothetical protein UIH27_11030 [Ruminococcus sp.]|nr:hypothetical protein [Ruminococcus sp.]